MTEGERKTKDIIDNILVQKSWEITRETSVAHYFKI